MSERAALWPLARAVARHTPIADLLAQLHQHALRATGGVVSVFLRLDPRAHQFHAVSAEPPVFADASAWLEDAGGRRAVEQVLTAGAPLVVDNVPPLIERLGSRAAVLVPVRSRHEALGVLVVGTDDVAQARAASDELSAVGDLVAVALECSRLQRDGDLQRDLRTLVSDLTLAVSSSLHLPASLRLFCERAARLLGAGAVAVWLHDRRARELELLASSDSAAALGTRLSSDAPKVAAMRGTRAAREPSGEGRPAEIILPLRGSRRALGLLTVAGLTPTPTEEVDLLDRLEEVARQVSAAIENVLLLEEVLRSRRELESTFNSMADLVVVVDMALTIAHANRAFAVRTGLRAADLAGRPVDEFFGPEIVGWLQQTRTNDDSAGASRELQDPRLGGVFLMTLSPLKGREDEPIGTVLVARDVTQQAQLEAERTELRDRLAQTEKLAALGQFVAGIAHELNNPLQGVLGHIELLLQDHSTVPSGFRRDLRLVLREADRAAKIVHDLLVFAGSRRITRRRLNVNLVVTRVLALRAAALTAAGIDAATELAAKPPRVSGDALLLQQALINIVVNAEQALTGSAGPRKLEIRTRSLGRKAVEIRIADNGPGLGPDVMPRLFEPFFTTKEVGQGTGLGLAIAYGIVQEHDGRLSATNGPEGGAVFTIELPAG